MCIHHNAFAHVERISKDDIGSFATYTGKLDQLCHRTRNFTVVTLDESGRHTEQTLRFVSKEPGRPDHVFEPLDLGAGKIAWSRKSLKKERSHHVHALVGALRTEDRCDEQLKGPVEIQLGMRIGIFFLQSLENFQCVSCFT